MTYFIVTIGDEFFARGQRRNDVTQGTQTFVNRLRFLQSFVRRAGLARAFGSGQVNQTQLPNGRFFRRLVIILDQEGKDRVTSTRFGVHFRRADLSSGIPAIEIPKGVFNRCTVFHANVINHDHALGIFLDVQFRSLRLVVGIRVIHEIHQINQMIIVQFTHVTSIRNTIVRMLLRLGHFK